MTGQEGIMPHDFPDKVIGALSVNRLDTELGELVAQTMWYSGDTEVNPGIANILYQGIESVLQSTGRKLADLEPEEADTISEKYRQIFHDEKNQELLTVEGGAKNLEVMFVMAFI